MSVTIVFSITFTNSLFFLGHYRISISVNLPLPPEKENEAELAESFLSRLMAILRHYDLENNSLQWVEKMRNPEGYDPRRIWVGIPIRIEYPLKGLDAQKLVNLQNEFTELISDHYLTDLSYCTILGTNKGTVYSRIRGNLQASSLYTDAFQNPSVIYQSIPILSSARPWLLENESLFNPSQYDEIVRNAHLDPSAGSCRISQLGSVIKDMFKGYGRKIIVRYNQSKERFMLSLSNQPASTRSFPLPDTGGFVPAADWTRSIRYRPSLSPRPATS